MRILSVSAVAPFPPHDGTRLRAWHLLRELAATDEVVVWTWAVPGDGAVAELGRLAADVVAQAPGTHRRAPHVRALRRLRALAGGEPAWIQAAVEERGGRAGLAAAHRAAAALHRRAPFDVVVAESEAASVLAPRLPGVAFVVHRHNVFAILMSQLGTRWPELSVWRRFDRQTAAADMLLATTPESAAALAPLAGTTPVRVVPNGAELRPPVPTAARRHVAFVGGLDYAPNRQGLTWFVRHVWPRVRRRDSCELIVVGRSAPGIPRSDGVRLLGHVDELDDALAQVAVGVVPLLAGMGIKNKTLDLLARGIPVVATPVGAEGLSGLDEGLLVATGADAFAAAVSDLLASPGTAVARGLAGRDAVAKRFSWKAAGAAYRAALAEAAVHSCGARP